MFPFYHHLEMGDAILVGTLQSLQPRMNAVSKIREVKRKRNGKGKESNPNGRCGLGL